MIKFKEDGKNYSSVFGNARTCYREIDAEEFDRLAYLGQAALNDEVESSLDPAICQYGFYGAWLTDRGGRFYVVYKKGISCD